MIARPSSLDWRTILILAVLGAAAWAQRGALREAARWVDETPGVCSGSAAVPEWVREIDSPFVAFLTTEADPLRSEQYFCLQHELMPHVVVRPTLAAPDARVGFGPQRPALIFANSEATRGRLLTQLAAEASGVAPSVRRASGGWVWLEVPAP